MTVSSRRPRLRLDRGAVVALAVLLVLIIIAVYGTLFLDRSTTDWLGREDGPIETIGALTLLVAGLLFLATFARLRRARDGLRHARAKEAVALLLGVLFMLGAGEEISWGQRLFDLATPASLREANAQGESNLHNLKPIHDGWLSAQRLFQLFWLGFGIALPVVAAASARTRERLGRLVPILPLWIAALLLLNQLLVEVTKVALDLSPGLYDGTHPNPTGELHETNISLLLAVGAYAVLRSTPRVGDAGRGRPATLSRT